MHHALVVSLIKQLIVIVRYIFKSPGSKFIGNTALQSQTDSMSVSKETGSYITSFSGTDPKFSKTEDSSANCFQESVLCYQMHK
jgi:hypothetical protein